MNLKKHMPGNRKGSYLVEAALTLPVFIMAAVVLALVVQMIAVCETIGFVTSRELKNYTGTNLKIFSSVSLSREIVSGVEQEWETMPILDGFKVKRVRTGFHSGKLEELNSVMSEAVFSVDTMTGISLETVFSQKLMARSFSGARQDCAPLGADAFMQTGQALTVLVYPKYGERFHSVDCSIVYYELEDGNPGWEMDVEEAQRQDFTPCKICGGGLK